MLRDAVGGSCRKTIVSHDCHSGLGFLEPMLERTLTLAPDSSSCIALGPV